MGSTTVSGSASMPVNSVPASATNLAVSCRMQGGGGSVFVIAACATWHRQSLVHATWEKQHQRAVPAKVRLTWSRVAALALAAAFLGLVL